MSDNAAQHADYACDVERVYDPADCRCKDAEWVVSEDDEPWCIDSGGPQSDCLICQRAALNDGPALNTGEEAAGVDW